MRKATRGVALGRLRSPGADASSPRPALPIHGPERTTAMLTTTIIFTVLVAAWGRWGTVGERASTRHAQLRSDR